MTERFDLEKTCENCEYELEDERGIHCEHCIHNATENFRPKKVKKECIAEIKIDKDLLQKMIDEKIKKIELDIQEIRNKAIDEFFNELCKVSESARPVGWTRRYCIVTIDKAMQIAEEMKGSDGNEID